MSDTVLEKTYDPKTVEQRWYQYWNDHRYFRPTYRKDTQSYCIVIPPPNVTGSLHMGHALNNTLQDILIRYKRMLGYTTLWQCGTDHAGIATQNVVERHIAAEGKTRFDLGRDAFVKRIWQWKEQYGGIIVKQLMKLGASCDWSRERFTMDEGCSRAVREVFVTLYHEGLIYRGNRLINWCPRCHTALSDLEVEHDEIQGNLYYIRYPHTDGNRFVTVATTRPETMLGDTAVAVNPDDTRYHAWIGKTLRLPLIDRIIPIIADRYVDKEFGTGALKVTPAHDLNDFELGRTYNLAMIKVIGDDGTMTAEAGKYAGLDRFEARKKIVADLQAQGLLEHIEPYRHYVGHCYRCKCIVEPNLSLQWFVKVGTLAEQAVAAVRTGTTRIIPSVWEKTFFEWMANIKDWCISRQIWWGHRIPAWYCSDCGGITVERNDPTQCSQCGSSRIEQDSDVLDTWFSSALWPFSTLGWPDKTPELERFYPTSCLVTGFDILFFWVARMMMMGLKFMGDVPFRDVYIHALVRDAEGQKMSKSKGNVIDPLEVIEKFGADSFRFTLTAMAAQGRDIKLSEERIEGYRHFVNKIWNAARFVLMNLEGYVPGEPARDLLELKDRWILSRMNSMIAHVRKSLDEYRFNDAAQGLYQFIWHELCDWYLEMAKPSLYQKQNATSRLCTQQVMVRVLKTSLELLHPIMPFVTEEIWQKIPGAGASIMVTTFPIYHQEDEDNEAEAALQHLIEIITAIRTIRSEMNVPPASKVHVDLLVTDQKIRSLVQEHASLLQTLASLRSLAVHKDFVKPVSAAAAVVDGAELFVNLEGIIDFEGERQRLQKEIKKISADIEFLDKKLSNENFLSRAPQDIIAKERNKLGSLREKYHKLKESITRLDKLCA